MRKAFSPLSKGEKSVTRNPRKLPALREDVSDQAPEKRQVFLLPFFRQHLCPKKQPRFALKALGGQGLCPVPKKGIQTLTGRYTGGIWRLVSQPFGLEKAEAKSSGPDTR